MEGSCDERLERLVLFSLEHRRLRGELTKVYKMRGTFRIVFFFRIVESRTKGHLFKLRGGKFKGELRGKIFIEGGVYLEQAGKGSDNCNI